MTYSNRGGDSFGGGNYGRRDFNARGSERSFGSSQDRPAMFDATCAQCGAACKVPFKPNGRKEVFCSKCFETNGGGSRESSYSAPKGRPSFSDRQMFSATCDQCGQRCEVPFRPTNGKPVLCSNCFAGKNDNRGPRSNENSFVRPIAPVSNSGDFAAINAKLDKILKLLSPTEPKFVKDESNEEAKAVAKDITAKILEEIEMTSGKKVETPKKKARVAKSKAE